MGEPNGSLVLGFVGGAEVHRDNACALIEDLISAYKRDHKHGTVRFYLALDPFTDTIVDLADYCLTSGYQLGLVGHEADFRRGEVRQWEKDAEGNIYKLKDSTLTAQGLVGALGVWEDSRLILLADPNEDDNAYAGVVAATGMEIPVRSLLNGLDKVVLESDDEEQIEMRRDDTDLDEEEEFDEEETDFDDDDLEEEVEDEEDLDDEDGDVVEEDEDDDLEDGDEEEPEDEDDDLEEEEPEDEESEDDGLDEEDADDEDADAEEGDVEDFDDDEEPEDEESDEEEEDEMPVKPKSKAKASPEVRMTESSLTRLAERDKDAFYELAADHDVLPGRGQKIPIMIRKVLEANGVTPAAPKRTAAPAAPAKRPVAKKTAPAAKPPVKKARTAEPAPAKRTAAAPAARTAPARRPVASSGLSKADIAAVAEATVTALVKALRRGTLPK